MSIIQGTAHTSAGGYQIERSLRFNSADSAYLNRTFSAGSSTQWTMSFWCKISGLGTDRMFLNGGDGTQTNSTNDYVGFNTGDQIVFVKTGGVAGNWLRTFSPVYRDISAWYHFVLVSNLGSGTVADRLQLYVNGVRVTAYTDSSTVPNTSWPYLNGAYTHNIGRLNAGSGPYYSNFYLTEINFIGGQALTPSSFGETDSATGVWKPKAFSGTYGTNGFYLKFADNSNTTSTTLGKDSSGNGNNWTPNNFSVTAGAGNDSLVDTPTSYGSDTGVGGEVRGNYATWNPLDKDDGITSVTNGNLNVVTNGSNGSIKSTIAFPSGKWYWEVTSDAVNSGGTQAIGIIPQSQPPTNNMSDTGKLGYALDVSNSDRKFENGTATSYGTYTQANGAIYMLAFDQDAGKLWYGINGTWLASGAPASGTNPSSSSIPTTTAYCAAVSDNTVSGTFTVNFGNRAFAYAAPSGFKALCTQNLPTPTIGATSTTQAGKYFNPVLYTGNGSTQSITGVGFQPDFVWIKNRGTATDHGLFDAIRGTTKRLSSNLTNAETTEVNSLTAFNSDGFSVGATQDFNQNTVGIVAWNWKANGSGSSNTAGTITSTVSANTTAGFSIVTYTGNGVNNATVGHGLGVAPNMVMVKSRSTVTDWNVKHSSLSSNNVVFLNNTLAQQTPGSGYVGNLTSSTVITLVNGGAAITNVNGNGTTYVAYCFAPIAGYSAFGSYTGNGSSDGPFVYTGFRPRYVMFKRTDTAEGWYIYDTVRTTINVMGAELRAESSAAESDFSSRDFLSNGFKIRTANGSVNASGGTYIFAAFAESPFKYSLAR